MSAQPLFTTGVCWHHNPICAFDTETTGTDPHTARVVTATMIMLHPAGATRVDRTWVINPGVPIPEPAAAIHGYTTQRAATEGMDPVEGIADIADQITECARRGIPIIAFNASYDLTVMARELERHGMPALPADLLVVDPLVIDKHLDRYRKGGRKLAQVAAHYGVHLSEADAHNATADALTAARVAWVQAENHPKLQVELPELHGLQQRWRWEQAEGLAKYWATKGNPRPVDGNWPYQQKPPGWRPDHHPTPPTDDEPPF